MKKILVRYRIKSDKVAENEQLVKEVYKQLHEKQIEGLRYTTVKLEDGVTFVHIAHHESEQVSKELSSLPAFKKFTENINDRCDEVPLVSSVSIIGAYNFIWDIN